MAASLKAVEIPMARWRETREGETDARARGLRAAIGRGRELGVNCTSNHVVDCFFVHAGDVCPGPLWPLGLRSNNNNAWVVVINGYSPRLSLLPISYPDAVL